MDEVEKKCATMQKQNGISFVKFIMFLVQCIPVIFECSIAL